MATNRNGLLICAVREILGLDPCYEQFASREIDTAKLRKLQQEEQGAVSWYQTVRPVVRGSHAHNVRIWLYEPR